MDKKQKEKEISRVLPLLWNSYQHMYDIRVNKVKDSVNFLLIIISFLSVISISLFIKENNILFGIPLILQMMALILLFKTFFVKSIVHWFKHEETLKDIKCGVFDRNLFAILKTLENWTNKYQKETEKIIKIALVLIIFSIFFIPILFTNIYLNSPITYLIYIIAMVLMAFLFIWYAKPSKYNFEKEDNQMKKNFNRWLG